MFGSISKVVRVTNEVMLTAAAWVSVVTVGVFVTVGVGAGLDHLIR